MEIDMKSALKDQKEEKVLNGLYYFRLHPSKDVEEDILNLTKSENFKIRKNAIETLAYLQDKQILEKIKDFSKDPEPLVRASFIFSVMKLKAKEYFNEIKDLIKDENLSVQIYAKGAYTLFGERDFKEEIKKYLSSRDFKEIFPSANVLSMLGDENSLQEVYNLIKSPLDDYRNIGAMALLDAPYSKKLLKELFDAIDVETYNYVLNNLSDVITYFGFNDIPYFTDLLVSSKKKTVIIKKILEYNNYPKILDEISKKINKGDNIKEITEVLENFNDDKSLILIRQIAFDKKIKGEKRYLAIRLLGKRGDKESIPNLRNLLKENDEYLRASSCYSLGLLKDLDSKDEIIKLLDDKSSRVRKASLSAVNQMVLKEAIEKVEKLLQDDDKSVRDMAKHVYDSLKKEEK